MKHKFLLLLLTLFSIFSKVQAYQVRGTISDGDGPLTYVGIYVKGTTYGVVSNIKGEYFIELEKGSYTLVYQAIGHQTEERSIDVTGNLVVNVRLNAVPEMLETLVIDKDREDPAYGIIRNAIKQKQLINQDLKSYKCAMYIKASLEVENLKKPDTSNMDLISRKRVNLIESWSDVYFVDPQLFKEVKHGYRNLAAMQANGVSVSFQFDEKEGVQNVEVVNPSLFFSGIKDGVFNFYSNLMYLTSLAEIPFTSPIADNALNKYKFRLMESFEENGGLVYKIRVQPKNTNDALFEGIIYIQDKVFTINAVELSLASTALRFFNHFTIIQNYSSSANGFILPVRQEFIYETQMGLGVTNYGQTVVTYQNYEPNIELSKKFMRNGKVVYDKESTNRDEAYWSGIRPVTLKSIESEFIHTQDSVIQYHKSAEYLNHQDSIINNLKFWDFILNGIQHQNTAAGNKWYAYPLVQQIHINTVDGYRHALGGGYIKDWKNGKQLELTGNVNYGFLNKNIRGEGRLRYMYDPFKFERIRLSYTNQYTMINTNNSIRGTFSPSNYSDNVGYGIGHEKEWFNGFLLKAYLDYNKFKPYLGKTIENFWEHFPLFSDPTSFKAFEELVLDVSARITFAQEYEIRPEKKVIMGSKYPIVEIKYSKGIKPWLKSDVNYDFVQLNASQYIRLGKLGISRLSLQSGRYFNDREVRLSNLRYFRGSDKYYFSNPLQTMQQLGDTSLRTSKTFAQINYVHHFNKTLLGRVNLFNRLGFQPAGGAGVLFLEETNLKYSEAFVGLEKPFRLWGQVFRFGTYYVGSTSSSNGFNHGVKFGIDFYNAYAHQWQY